MYQPLSSGRSRRAVRLAKGAGGLDVRADMLTTRVGPGPARRSPRRGGGWQGRVNGRLETIGVTWGNVPLTRHFSPTIRSADCPSRRRWDIRDNVAVLC